jgi:tetratricopeptide (TPR) repeat protein
LYLGAEAPYMASKVMKKGIESKTVSRDAKNLEIWAVSLSQAQDLKNALPVMEEAAQKMDNGKIYATLAAIYLNADKYDDAVSAARKALNKGGLRSQGEVHMYMGSAYLGLKKYDDAIKALREAVKDEKYKTHAQNLMKYVQNEKTREEGLKNANLDA